MKTMRLIDADELLKDEHIYYYYLTDEHYIRVRDVEDAPTIDAVEVVRCKDCKHYDGKGVCMKIGIAMLSPNWYCADGARKDTTDE